MQFNFKSDLGQHYCFSTISVPLTVICDLYAVFHNAPNVTETMIGHNTKIHDDVIKWRHSPRYWPFVRVPEYTVVQTIVKLVIRDAIAPIMTSPLCGAMILYGTK